MEKYEKIKQIGRKYLAPAIVVGALALGVNAYFNGGSLPVYNRTKEVMQGQEESLRQQRTERLDNLESDFNERVESSRDKFNESILDGIFDKSEQRVVCSKYKVALKASEKLKSLSKEYKVQEYGGVELSAQDNKLYKLLDKNLNGVDIGLPNLEKCLRSEGLDVVVGSVYNRGEKYKFDYIKCMSGVGAFFGALFSLAFIADRKSRKDGFWGGK